MKNKPLTRLYNWAKECILSGLITTPIVADFYPSKVNGYGHIALAIILGTLLTVVYETQSIVNRLEERQNGKI